MIKKICFSIYVFLQFLTLIIGLGYTASRLLEMHNSVAEMRDLKKCLRSTSTDFDWDRFFKTNKIGEGRSLNFSNSWYPKSLWYKDIGIQSLMIFAHYQKETGKHFSKELDKIAKNINEKCRYKFAGHWQEKFKSIGYKDKIEYREYNGYPYSYIDFIPQLLCAIIYTILAMLLLKLTRMWFSWMTKSMS